jgi:hypothetical protein
VGSLQSIPHSLLLKQSDVETDFSNTQTSVPDIITEHVILKKPSRLALLLGLVPFGAMCFSVPLWDRVNPLILGIPFNLFWLISWILLSTLCMWAAHRVQAARDGKDS